MIGEPVHPIKFPPYITKELRNYYESCIELFQENNSILKRLIFDSRMKEVFEFLAKDFDTEIKGRERIAVFIRLANTTAINYAVIKVRKKSSLAVKERILSTSEELINLLQLAGGIGDDKGRLANHRARGDVQNLPHELYDIGALLNRCSIEPISVLYDSKEGLKELTVSPEDRDRRWSYKLDISEDTRSDNANLDIDDMFFLPITVPDILTELRKIVTAWEPTFESYQEAAICSRQRNPTNEFVRGFADILTSEKRPYWLFSDQKKKFKMTKNLKKAIAIVACVVLNDPDKVVTYANVGEAIRD